MKRNKVENECLKIDRTIFKEFERKCKVENEFKDFFLNLRLKLQGEKIPRI
jgi:hypothetical protein